MTTASTFVYLERDLVGDGFVLVFSFLFARNRKQRKRGREEEMMREGPVLPPSHTCSLDESAEAIQSLDKKLPALF